MADYLTGLGFQNLGKNIWDYLENLQAPITAYTRGDIEEGNKRVSQALDEYGQYVTTPEGAIELASPLTKVGGLIGKTMSRAEAEALGLWHPISGTKLKQPYDTMTSKVVPFENEKTVPLINPERLYGGTGIGAKGDRSNIGYLTEINNKVLPEPVKLTGGGRFMDYNPDIWASEKGRVTTIANKAREIAEEGRDPYLIYTTAGHGALGHNTMLSDALLQDTRAMEIPAKWVDEFDKTVRKTRPEWKGILHPESKLQLLNNTDQAGALRHEVTRVSQLKEFYDKGFPDLVPIKKGITDPNLLDLPDLSTGYRIGQIDPNKLIITNPRVPHPTYNTNIGGLLVGQTEVPIPYEKMFQDFYNTRRLEGKPISVDHRAFDLGFPTQEFNQQWLDNIMPYYEAQTVNRSTEAFTPPKGLIDQQYTSAKTSINKDKLPAVFNKLDWDSGSVNLDVGGGKFDNATEFLADKNVKNLVYDPFNRTAEHNTMVLNEARNTADTATISNVLNVIPDEANQIKTLETAYKHIKPNGKVYITVYEGNKSGVGKVTGADQYQQNKKLQDYLSTVKKVFPNVKIEKGMIIATKE